MTPNRRLDHFEGLRFGAIRMAPIERRPAAVFLMATVSPGARVVEQPCPTSRERGGSVQLKRVDLHGPTAASAGDSQQMPADVAEPLLPDRVDCGPGIGGDVVQDGLPVFGRHLVARTDVGQSWLRFCRPRRWWLAFPTAFGSACASLRGDRSWPN